MARRAAYNGQKHRPVGVRTAGRPAKKPLPFPKLTIKDLDAPNGLEAYHKKLLIYRAKEESGLNSGKLADVLKIIKSWGEQKNIEEWLVQVRKIHYFLRRLIEKKCGATPAEAIDIAREIVATLDGNNGPGL